ncbi:HpcH/HpaI aldolase family protein [Niallia endozanthoxylica]|uniref:2-dehydro-3-deoxyglucarate aldolase n=1 Tax=Niallia endozanthoxylica TaxID=2036016 RepID=A0A5J5H4Z3_9BACI|nr:aldolase/citrate lyase family protein [Niallia endozanthoxylica]KAA9015745.1 2-dehydro-3-deoxyglucarate aldolase [Niallia endozanthoxylica]
MRKNALKKKIGQSKNVFGTWIMTNSLDNAEILGHTGVDFIMIDAEHGSMDIESAGRMVSVIRGTQATPLLRVAGNEKSLIKKGLDTGASGIMIPMVNTKAEAEEAVSNCKYPPVGVRGIGAGRAVLFGAAAAEYEDYYAQANEEVLVILQIEHYTAVENIEEILSVPNIDIAFIGPYDLSTSMGLQGQLNHPDVLESCQKVIEACDKFNVTPGIMTWTDGIEQHLNMGFQFLLGGIDGAILYNGVKQLVNEFNGFAN